MAGRTSPDLCKSLATTIVVMVAMAMLTVFQVRCECAPLCSKQLGGALFLRRSIVPGLLLPLGLNPLCIKSVRQARGCVGEGGRGNKIARRVECCGKEGSLCFFKSNFAGWNFIAFPIHNTGFFMSKCADKTAQRPPSRYEPWLYNMRTV